MSVALEFSRALFLKRSLAYATIGSATAFSGCATRSGAGLSPNLGANSDVAASTSKLVFAYQRRITNGFAVLDYKKNLLSTTTFSKAGVTKSVPTKDSITIPWAGLQGRSINLSNGATIADGVAIYPDGSRVSVGYDSTGFGRYTIAHSGGTTRVVTVGRKPVVTLHQGAVPSDCGDQSDGILRRARPLDDSGCDGNNDSEWYTTPSGDLVDVSDFTMDTGDSLNADACAAAFQQLGADLFAVTAGMLGIIATLSACLGAYIAGKRFIIPVVPALLEVPCDAALAIFEAAEAVAVQAALNDIAQIASGIC